MKRAGVTQKVSISVDREDLAIVKRRAKRLHGGNVSAVFAEMVQWTRQQEARAAVLASFPGAPITQAELDAVRQEWREPTARASGKKSRGKRQA